MPEMLQIEPPHQKQQPQHEIRVPAYDPKQVREEAVAKVSKLVEDCKALIRQNPDQHDVISSFSMILQGPYKEQIIGIYNAIVEESNYALRNEKSPFHLKGELKGDSFYFVAGYYDRKPEMPVTASTVVASPAYQEKDGKEEKQPPKLEEMDLTLNEQKRQAIMELAYILSGKSKDSFPRLPADRQVKAIHKAVQYMVVDDAGIEERKRFYGRIGYSEDFWFFIKAANSTGVKLPNETLPAGLKAGSVVEGDCDEVALICRAVLGSCGIKADVVQFFYKEEGREDTHGHTTLLSVGNSLLVVDSALLKNVEELKIDQKDSGNEDEIKRKISELYKDRQKFDISRIAILHDDNQIKARILENNWYEVSEARLTEKNISWIRRALEADPNAVFSNTRMAEYWGHKDTGKAMEYFKTALKSEPDNFETNRLFAVFVLNNGLSDNYLEAYESIKNCYAKDSTDDRVLVVKREIELRLGYTEEAAKTMRELNAIQNLNH